MSRYNAYGNPNQGKALVSENGTRLKQSFDVDPYPKFQEITVANGNTGTIIYQNGVSEVSKIKRIRIRAPPEVTFSMKRTKDGVDQTVISERNVEDMPMVDGWYVMDFKTVSADVPLTLDRSMTLTLEFSNGTGGTATITADVVKDAKRFYEYR